MLTELRSQMKLIMWILVFAFLGTIVFSWGMGGFKDNAQAGIVGDIDGQEIAFEDFQRVVQNLVEAEKRKSNSEPDADQIKKIRENAWDDYIEVLLKRRDAERLGIKVTDLEVAHVIENFPPPEIRKAELFQRDGEFDQQAYMNFLRTPQATDFLLGLERSVFDYLIEQKLIFQVVQSADLTEEEIKDKYIQDNVTGKLKFITVPFKGFEIDSTEITEEMTLSYYRKFPGGYKQYPQRKFAYVKFEVEPSSLDSSDVLSDANMIIDEIKSGLDFAELAKEWSKDEGSGAMGGDLGWFGRGKMAKSFNEAAFGSTPGKILGPILSKSGYHIIEVLEKSGSGEEDSIKARHILLSIEATTETKDDVHTSAYNFAQEAKERGFTTVAEELEMEIDTTKNFSKAGYIAGLGRMRMAAQFCFNNPLGTVSSVYPSPLGYLVFEIVDIIEESTKPYDDVEVRIRKKLKTILEKGKALDITGDIRASIETVDDFESSVKDTEFRVHVTEDSIKSDGNLPDGLPADKDFLKEAFRLEKGEISGIIEGKKSYYIACMLDKSPFDKVDFEAKHEFFYQQLIGKVQDGIARNWVRELRIAAEINDYRYKFFKDF